MISLSADEDKVRCHTGIVEKHAPDALFRFTVKPRKVRARGLFSTPPELLDAQPVALERRHVRMFMSRAIGFVSGPYKDTSEVPKGLGAKHEADGVLRILPEFELGLTDIEGFSHLIVLWEFDRAEGFDLLGTPPSDNRPHGVFATRSPRRPNPIALTIVELLRRESCELHVRGVDMLDGTAILDIKPLLSSIPAERLRRGWLAEAEARRKS
jgi:tRNA-Thr(GGU) m(6)t(6)A37 methyltransferase TsaA